MVQINETWKKQGKVQAIQAWEIANKKADQIFFRNQQPQNSEDYPQWFNALCNSAGLAKKIEDNWAFVFWMHLEKPIWINTKYLSKA